MSSCDCLSDHLSKDEIFALVNQNDELLNKTVSEINSSKSNNSGISSTQKAEVPSLDYSILKGLEKITVEDDIIDFSCGGAGIGSSTSYYGFYYSEKDNLTATWCCGGNVVQEGKGWSWEEPDGDNSYYTEKIRDHFYYYEAHF